MRTVGVDLAAQDRDTAIAVLDWDSEVAVVTSLRMGASDHEVLEATQGAHQVGVDCPFGWPVHFVAMVREHEQFELLPPQVSGAGWRRELTLRATDLYVHARTGLTPLRVSADRIAHPAMRWAAITAQLAERGHDVRRDGAGPLAEVYPAAALQIWGLTHRGYKGAANWAVREQLVERLSTSAPWLRLGDHAATCRAADHALDAVICGLVARAVRLGLTEPPSSPAPADTEGWIHLPACTLDALAP